MALMTDIRPNKITSSSSLASIRDFWRLPLVFFYYVWSFGALFRSVKGRSVILVKWQSVKAHLHVELLLSTDWWYHDVIIIHFCALFGEAEWH